MKEVPLQEWAKRLLEDQIERLGELRNANPRDQSFKLWRQTTLTVIQRLWPGNLPKSEAFRRIAFTTPSARATRNQVRQHYERGAAEAVSYLRGLMLEIDGGALGLGPDNVAPLETAEPSIPLAPEPEPAADAPRTGALDEGLVGSGPLGGSTSPPQPVPTGPPLKFISPAFERDPEFRTLQPPAPVASKPAATAPAPAPLPTPAASNAAPVPEPARPASNAVPASLSRPVSAVPPPTPPVNAAPPEPKPSFQQPMADKPAADASQARRPEKRALKEMLGFIDAPGHSPRGAEAPRGPGIVSTRGVIPSSARAVPPAVPAERRDDWPEPVEAREEEIDDTPDPFAHDESEAAEPADEPAAMPEPTDLLRHSPVFAPRARAANDAPRPAPAHPAPHSTVSKNTHVAAVLNALAADVTRLGVPEGQRAATRAALVGLGRQFDEGTATWSSVRQTFVMALEFPALARLLIPSLVPYLDLE